jgi:hypothetical protein
MISLLTYCMCLTHPVNFPCGRKPEYPEKTHDFRQSVELLLFSHEDWVRVTLRSSHWGLNLWPQRWKASALTTLPLNTSTATSCACFHRVHISTNMSTVRVEFLSLFLLGNVTSTNFITPTQQISQFHICTLGSFLASRSLHIQMDMQDTCFCTLLLLLHCPG